MPVRVNRGALMSAALATIRSPEYQRELLQEVKRRRKSGEGGEDLGIKIITEADMASAANALRHVLYDVAAASGIPGSVLEHVGSTTISGISYNADETKAHVTVSFVGDFSRPSMIKMSGSDIGGATGGGVEDIVELFDKGYDASGRVYGYWESGGFGGSKAIPSRKSREGLGFLDEAISRFNAEYGPMYHCVAQWA